MDELAEAFPYCESFEDLALVIEDYPNEVVEGAISLVPSAPLRQQLRGWLDQLSQPNESGGGKLAQSENPPLTSYKPGDEVWGYFPMSEAKWLRAVVESAGNGLLRIKSGFFGMWVESSDYICPGSWEFS